MKFEEEIKKIKQLAFLRRDNILMNTTLLTVWMITVSDMLVQLHSGWGNDAWWNFWEPSLLTSYEIHRKLFVTSDIAWPNGLAVDWTKRELFWTDAKTNSIQAIGIDGRNRRTVIRGQWRTICAHIHTHIFLFFRLLPLRVATTDHPSPFRPVLSILLHMHIVPHHIHISPHLLPGGSNLRNRLPVCPWLSQLKLCHLQVRFLSFCASKS